jgi:hypothetical protein
LLENNERVRRLTPAFMHEPHRFGVGSLLFLR